MATTGRGYYYPLPSDPPDLATIMKANADSLDAYKGQVDSVLSGAAAGSVAAHRGFTFAQTTVAANATQRITLTASAYDRASGSNMAIGTSANAGAVVVSASGVYQLSLLYRAVSAKIPHLRVNGLSVAEAVSPGAGFVAELVATVVLASGDVVELVVQDVAGSAASWPGAASVDSRAATTPPNARLTMTRIGG